MLITTLIKKAIQETKAGWSRALQFWDTILVLGIMALWIGWVIKEIVCHTLSWF